jgi:DNA-binding transcriptional regulator LsrR (DeoR family)
MIKISSDGGNVVAIGALRDEDASMAARAAWMHYAGGMTQSEVAKRLGLTGLKAHRLITKANQEGLVRVFVDGDVAECVELENRVSERFGLNYCEVVPDFDSDELPLKALGLAGARFLMREMLTDGVSMIGVGHGRTLAACVQYMPRTTAAGVRFVSLLGGLTRKFSANPHDVIHRLAERTSAEAFVMPVPMFANTAEDRDVLLGQRGIGEVLGLARTADLLLAGIGTALPEASLVATGMISRSEMEEVKNGGGVGELLGHFFDAHGRPFETNLSGRILALARDDLRDRRIVAVAGGKIKIGAIRSILKSGYLSGLVTDEQTAKSLMEELPVG